jgi:O-antigen/teichoic acid export membrane protein
MNLRKNSFFVSTGAFLRLLVSLVSIPLLIRFLGLNRYGIWTVLNSVVAIAALMELGLSIAMTIRVSASQARQDWVGTKDGLSTSFVLITCMGVTTSLGLWLVSPLLVKVLFSSDKLGQVEVLPALGLLSWVILLRFWQQWSMAVEAALLRYDLQAIMETLSGLFLQIGIVIIALAKGSMLMLAAWSVFTTGLTLVGHYLILKRIQIIRMLWFRFSWQEARDLIRFGVMQWVSSLGSTLFGYADRIIVNLFLGTGAAGLYSAVTSVAVQINSLSAIPLRVIPPAISSAKALSQQDRVQQIFIRATKLNGLFVLLIAAPIMFWSHPLARILVGQEYITQTAKFLQILGVVYGIYSLNAAGFFTAIGIGRPILNARWSLISGTSFCIILVVFILWIGLIGAVWANMAFALSLMTNIQVIKLIKINHWAYLKTFFPAVLMIILWGLISTILNNIPMVTLSTNILLFLILGLVSVFFVGGFPILRDTISMFITTKDEKVSLRKFY